LVWFTNLRTNTR